MGETAMPALDPRDVYSEALTWPARAQALRIRDAATYIGATDLLKGIKGLRARIAETFDPHIDRAHKAHKALVAEKKQAETPLELAEREIKRQMTAYDTEQEQIRQAEQRRLADLARAQEEERRMAEALAAEAAGAMDEAEAILAEAIAAPPPVISIPKATPTVEGVSYRTTYRAEVTDLLALVRFVAATPAHVNLLVANGPALNQMARAMREAMRIPGVSVIAERNAAVRA